MSTNVVNLDALIPREDLGVLSQQLSSQTDNKITIPHLTGFVFGPDLRKPQFQRETNQWTPKKVVELLTAFVDRDLIPAVILWRAGQYIFVVDGAHRLSALLAWVKNDYGDGVLSQAFFGGKIPDEQQKIAKKTREMVNKAIGSWTDHEEAMKGVPKPEYIMKRVGMLSDCGMIAQWVPTSDPESAEASFFKINQAATPIDPTERRLLKARNSASAVAARAITNAGTGNKYWGKFGPVARSQIEACAAEVYGILYSPPITGSPINTLDVPIAGQGYNALPFVFDLVNDVNDVGVPDSSKKQSVKESLPIDEDGSLTLSYLKRVRKSLEKISTDHPGSLGLHPVVYFYTRGGAFKPEAFLAAQKFVQYLNTHNALKAFQKVRKQFEDYLVDHKEALALIVHRFGTGHRSIPRLVDYYKVLFDLFKQGLSPLQVTEHLTNDADFKFLTVSAPSPKPKKPGTKAPFTTSTKTTVFFAQALASCIRCTECGARVHKNSQHVDHAIAQKDGGHSGPSNGQITHPYCDSAKG